MTIKNTQIATFCNSSGYIDVKTYYSKIACYPEPDPLNPCEDVVGFVWLRGVIWFVWVMAIFGNVVVMAILCATNQSRLRVNHFLMMNLAFADFCTGVYMAMLAVQDARTAGEYYNFAVDWQTGWGCNAAGFLAVFASELSIFTMVVISFEVRQVSRSARPLTTHIALLLNLIPYSCGTIPNMCSTAVECDWAWLC